MALLSHVPTVFGFMFLMILVVFFHELGHFLAGRACRVRIDAFSVGFGPEVLAATDRRGTRWRLSAIPLGGYVKFRGEGELSPKAQPVDPAPADPDGLQLYGDASVWQRAFIVAAGPAASILLAIVLFAGLFGTLGVMVLKPRIATVVENSVAARQGFQAGDLVTAIDGAPIDSFMDMQRIVQASSDVPLAIDVDRDGAVLRLTATPERKDVTGEFGTARVGVLGITASRDPADVSVKRMGPIESVSAATGECWYVVSRTASYIGGVFVGRETVAQLSGPVKMVEVTDKVVQLGFAALLNLAAFYSVSIGFFNLLPIPPLDGGRLFLYMAEILRRRPLSERVQEYGFRFGIAVIVTLLLCATYNDVLPHVLSLFRHVTS